jgi:hypothetical protein
MKRVTGKDEYRFGDISKSIFKPLARPSRVERVIYRMKSETPNESLAGCRRPSINSHSSQFRAFVMLIGPKGNDARDDDGSAKSP